MYIWPLSLGLALLYTYSVVATLVPRCGENLPCDHGEKCCMGTCYRLDFCWCRNDTECSSGEKCNYGVCQVSTPPTIDIIPDINFPPRPPIKPLAYHCVLDSECSQGSSCEYGECVENHGEETSSWKPGWNAGKCFAVFFSVVAVAVGLKIAIYCLLLRKQDREAKK